MSGHRQAAVTLHALGADDRRWIMAALEPRDRIILDALLGELSELGFDGALMPLPAPAAGPAPAPARAGGTRTRIRQASAAQMAHVLEPEPVSLVRQVLGIEAWPWHDEFLALQSGPRLALLRAGAGRDDTAGAARHASLLSIIDGALAALPAPPSGAPARAPRFTLKHWIGQWTR